MIAITGVTGQLGKTMLTTLKRRGILGLGFDRHELNIADQNAVVQNLRPSVFDCIINCAAYTAVDEAEDHSRDAIAVNATAPKYLTDTGIPIIHVSTDYVFDGRARQPYEVDSQTAPMSVYGRSKQMGEAALLTSKACGCIIRTSRLYSPIAGTRSFFQTMLQLLSERQSLGVVSDQFSAPTLAEDLADALVELYLQGAHLRSMQVLHFTNTGETSWHGFASAIQERIGTTCKLEAIPAVQYPTKARRPHYSVLSLQSLQAWRIKPRSWQDALTEACVQCGRIKS
ncbi:MULTISPECIES: dTDP-4-dehydrorhamnose reductase [Sutterella]|uniref:dTDP-4-dehydrorhamnose reductase n=2 Tax=Sutterellaceae TaxID=995019 RepID=UPI00265CF5ED|nr:MULTISPECIES: dTDP-4-dehydrorhamnose reductase [Sutterella]MDR3967082.1 dTDP-4-dehydrorhamnose reductase [Sutterella sp.]